MKTLLYLVVMGFALVSGAQAGNHAYGPYVAAYQKECGDCHLPYPPPLMDAEGWKRLMGGLEHHFGTDASLDKTVRDEISVFLASRAAVRDKYRTSAAMPRITATPWFRRKHGDLTVKAAAGQPAAAQCELCHRSAVQGNFGERDIKLPAGYRHREGARS